MYWGGFAFLMFTYGPWQSLLKYGAALLLFFLAYLFIYQSSLLYVPEIANLPRHNCRNPKGYSSPTDINLPFENINFKADDGEKLHAWLILQSEDKHAIKSTDAPTIIYFHGNAGNIGLRMPNYKELYARCKVNIFAVEYRGYGDSTGRPTEKGLKLDAEAALRYIATRSDVIDPKQLVLFGRSLGGAVVSYLASSACASTARPDPKIRGVVLENTFTSVEQMALQLFPLLNSVRCVLSRLLENKWENAKCIPRINRPLLFLSSGRDQIVPPVQMRSMYEMARDAAEIRGDGTQTVSFEFFPNCGHNDMPYVEGKPNLPYYEAINTFLNQHVRS